MSVTVNTTVAGGSAAMSGSGAGGGGGGGSDLTAATLGAYGIATYTAGAQWVIYYDGSGIPLYEYLNGDPGSTLRSNLTDVGSGVYVISSGLKHVSGALVMTLAQRTTWTAIVGVTIDLGFKVFVSDVGSIIDASGTTVTPGAECVWAGSTLGWLWTTPVRYCAFQTGTSITNASGALATSREFNIAGNVIGPYDQVFMSASINMTGTAGSRHLQMNIGGVSLYNATALGASATQSLTVIKTLNGIGVNSQQHGGANSSALSTTYDTQGNLPAALATSSIDTSVTVNANLKATVASGDTAVCRLMSVHVTSNSGITS